MDIKRDLQKCVHCGLCLSACPTYGVTGNEAESPRGRIYLIRAACEGRLAWTRIAPHIDACLGCLACETACPSGVVYSNLVDVARERIEHSPARSPIRRFVRKRLISTVTNPVYMRWLSSAIHLFSRPGRARIPAFASRLISRSSGVVELPAIPSEQYQTPEFTEAVGPVRGRVAMLTGCVQKLLLPAVNRATVRALALNGFEVMAPRSQGCCGALWAHNGYPEHAREFALRNLEAFREADAVIVNSAGCGSTMKSYSRLFAGTPHETKAIALASRTYDVMEYLDKVGVVAPMGPIPLTVGYHDACHLAHGQGITAAPRRILQAIPELQLKEIVDSDRCCGSAGIYNIVQPRMAKRLLDAKVATIVGANIEAVASANPGCSLWIAQGIRHAGAPIRVVHPIELLERSHDAAQPKQR